MYLCISTGDKERPPSRRAFPNKAPKHPPFFDNNTKPGLGDIVSHDGSYSDEFVKIGCQHFINVFFFLGQNSERICYHLF